MKNINVSTKNMGQFAGKWVAIDPVKNQIVAVGETMNDIASLVTHTADEKTLPVGKAPFSFLVPRKDEGPYILWVKF